jgi:hypothetical protein
MRKIELEMNRAITYGNNWSNGNTMVTSHNNGMSEVFLHGHHIARVWRFGDDVQVNTETLKEWPTRTTMSRLRALGADVCTRKGAVMLDGEEVA